MIIGRPFSLPRGRNVEAAPVSGYPIDFTSKARSSEWPPAELPQLQRRLHVITAQWGLGCVERYLDGDGDEWLAGAVGAARHLAAIQGPGGGWVHRAPMSHTFSLQPPWLSAMAQGEGASLLVRVAALAGEEELAPAARRAVAGLCEAPSPAGLVATLGSGAFPQEYPTAPPSHVLNGGIFALWGLRDVAIACEDGALGERYRAGVDTLEREIDRWDTGRWSLYDLLERPLPNVASPAYHQLHIDQLRAMDALEARPRLAAAADRFEAYADSRVNRARAVGTKVGFRLAIPRNRLLAGRLPWDPSRRG